ncbi:VOC family protein [Novosphingobium sp.]|uniref:VOC family protein n=1 Tax=Novosphingobium sp. TaxID=1874826 RepID=UPI0035B46235
MKVAALTYVVVKTSDPQAWRAFASDVLGMSVKDAPGGLALKMDERAGRVFVEAGDADCFFASGWELRSEAEFAAACEELRARDVSYTAATSQECALRHVFDMVWFRDPAGNRHELSYGYVTDFDRFASPVGVPGFVTGELGLGHMVLPAPNIAETRQFLIDVLGFGLSDVLIHRPAPDMAQRIDFMHCDNGRHHSLALFEGEVPSGCVHLMFEVESLDEVGRAYDRMQRAGVRLMATLGKHTNDHMTSFYFMSPGGFAIEYGFGGRTIDWDHHTVFESTSVSLWGHDFSVGFGADEQAALANAA